MNGFVSALGGVFLFLFSMSSFANCDLDDLKNSFQENNQHCLVECVAKVATTISCVDIQKKQSCLSYCDSKEKSVSIESSNSISKQNIATK